ncbi:MAG: DUF928 domain-containing protein, partial [Methylococcales bacterium]
KNLGAPKMRVNGGIRGQNQTGTELLVLAPEQMGLTAQSQPVLYWYVSQPVKQPVEMTVTDKRTVLLKATLDGVSQAGIQTLNLADHDVRLKPDSKYKWSIAIVNDPKQRSADSFASAGIMWVSETGLPNKLAGADDQERIRVYAEAGLWYDALAAAQSLAEKNPGDTLSVAIRTSLLQQVGLSALH